LPKKSPSAGSDAALPRRLFIVNQFHDGRKTLKFRLLSLAAILAATTAPALAKQPIETETARLPKKGHGNVQLEFEYGTSDEGRDIAMPLVLEYGITDRLKFVVEPDLYASAKPKGGKASSGFGDTEAKLVYLVSEETDSTPAFALAAEIKIPTGKRPDLSTGKPDYRVVAIGSKRAGRFDLHANLGYTIVKSPAGESLPNLLDYGFAAEYEVSKTFSLVGEVLGTSPLGGKRSILPVAAGAETEGTTITGMVGGIVRVSSKMDFALATTYDSGGMLLFRTALTFKF
jgi:hypothetical protein